MPKEIRVTTHVNQYNPGEIATFDDKIAADIIKRNLGEEVQRDKKGNVTNDPLTNVAEKPIGDPAPSLSEIPEGSTTSDQPVAAALVEPATPAV